MSHELHEMSEATYLGCLANDADLTADGYRRRLLAVRTAIRMRNPETGERHFCHLRHYRAVYAASARQLRRIIKRLEQPT